MVWLGMIFLFFHPPGYARIIQFIVTGSIYSYLLCPRREEKPSGLSWNRTQVLVLHCSQATTLTTRTCLLGQARIQLQHSYLTKDLQCDDYLCDCKSKIRSTSKVKKVAIEENNFKYFDRSEFSPLRLIFGRFPRSWRRSATVPRFLFEKTCSNRKKFEKHLSSDFAIRFYDF